MTQNLSRIIEIAGRDLLPQEHKDYLIKMRDEMKYTPKVAYDIGACVLHWTNSAKQIWPDTEYVAFEAMDETKFIYEGSNIKHFNGVLSDTDGKIVDFYQNLEWFGGNSYYKENSVYSYGVDIIFNESHIIKKPTHMLDSVVKANNFPAPDLIKIDVQGAELDVLRGAEKTLESCQHIIVELQHKEYNKGAPHFSKVVEYLDSRGFALIGNRFVATPVDGDYHFARK